MSDANKTTADTRDGRCCKTCRWWQGEEMDGMKICEWPEPDLPFWASISNGPDHANWTRSRDGGRCSTWECAEDAR